MQLAFGKIQNLLRGCNIIRSYYYVNFYPFIKRLKKAISEWEMKIAPLKAGAKWKT